MSKEKQLKELKTKVKDADSKDKRRAIVSAFYKIIRNGMEIKVHNIELGKDISINAKSERKTISRAGKDTTSTLAVFELLEIMKNATVVKDNLPPKKKTEKQKTFEKLIEMSCVVVGLGEVKLMVAVDGIGKHIQYSLSAVE